MYITEPGFDYAYCDDLVPGFSTLEIDLPQQLCPTRLFQDKTFTAKLTEEFLSQWVARLFYAAPELTQQVRLWNDVIQIVIPEGESVDKEAVRRALSSYISTFIDYIPVLFS